MEKNKIGRAEIILNKILESPTVSIENPSGMIHIDNQTLAHSSQQRKLIFKNILELY